MTEQSLQLVNDSQIHISLHALQVVAGGNTLQLIGLIKKQKVVFWWIQEVHTISSVKNVCNCYDQKQLS